MQELWAVFIRIHLGSFSRVECKCSTNQPVMRTDNSPKHLSNGQILYTERAHHPATRTQGRALGLCWTFCCSFPSQQPWFSRRETSPCFQAAPPLPPRLRVGNSQCCSLWGLSVHGGGCQQVAMATTLLSLSTFLCFKRGLWRIGGALITGQIKEVTVICWHQLK